MKLGPVTISSVTVLNFGKEGIAFFGLTGSSGWDSITISNSSITNNLDGIQSWAPANRAHTNILVDGVTAYSNPGKSASGSGSGIVLELTGKPLRVKKAEPGSMQTLQRYLVCRLRRQRLDSEVESLYPSKCLEDPKSRANPTALNIFEFPIMAPRTGESLMMS